MRLSDTQKLKKFKNSLNGLFRFLEKHYHINHGGCCWVTYCLAKNFERLNMEFQLVIYDEDRLGYSEQIYFNIKERNLDEFPNGENCAYHYTLKVKSLGILNKDNLDYITVPNIDAEDILWIYQTGDWNSKYNCRLNDEIKNIIDNVFKIYEEEQAYPREVA